MIGIGFSHLLMGPSKILNLPDQEWVIITGMALLGVFLVPGMVPITQEILERLQVGLKIHEDDTEAYEHLNDKVNDVFGFVYALTQFVAPLVASQFYRLYGMRTTFDITGFSCFVYAFILIIFNCGPSYKSENAEFKKQLA